MLKLLFKLFKKSYVKHLNKQVEKYWNIYRFDMEPGHISHNNEGDAFKHAFMAAELASLFGERITRKICLLQEDTNSDNSPAERHMDLHNDEWGIMVGMEIAAASDCIADVLKEKDKIAERVMKEMRKGNLITRI